VRPIGPAHALSPSRQRRQLVRNFAARTPTIETPARNLCGGHIQQLILARELSSGPRVLLASQPTRGVDVGAAEYIHRCLSNSLGRSPPPS
jgi:ABC-type uncharacterized transport system ATPase subunit